MSRILYFNEEEHTYTDDLHNNYISTTTLLGDYEVPYDTKGEAKRLARLGKGIYKNKSARQIEQMWKDSTEMACAKGNVTHDGLENGIKQVSMFKDTVKILRTYDETEKNRLFTLDDVMGIKQFAPVDPIKFYEIVGHKYPIIQQTIEYYTRKGYLLFAELGIYDEKRLISGMIDLFAYRHPYFVIIDWKTNKDDISFESYYYKRDADGQDTDKKVVKKKDFLIYPLDDLINCKGNKYAMQLSVYAKMCEQRGLICEGIVIFHIRDQYKLNKYGRPLRDDKNNYVVDPFKGKRVEVVTPDYLTEHVDRVFADHMKKRHSSGVQYSMGF